VTTNSGTLAVFEHACAEMLGRLSAAPMTAESTRLGQQVVALETRFRSWQASAPSSEQRAQAVSELLDLNRAVAEYLAHPAAHGM
jgi:hypothetical protein